MVWLAAHLVQCSDGMFSQILEVSIWLNIPSLHCTTLVSAPDPFLQCACAKGGGGGGGGAHWRKGSGAETSTTQCSPTYGQKS